METIVRTQKYSPYRDKVLIRPYMTVRYRRGKIVIPEGVTDKLMPQQGKILSVGPEVTLVGPGDTVLYGRHVGRKVRVNDESLLLMSESDLIAEID